MHVAPFILASGDDTELFKLVGIAIILVIAAIGALVKKVREGQSPQARRPVPPPLPGRPVPLAARVRAPGPKPLPPLPALAQAAKPRPTTARRAAVRRQAAPVRQQAGAQPSRLSTPAPAVPGVRATPSLPASSVANLLNPTTVRAQFILAEVLQPPLSLRARKTF
ncbi:MAG TPA: hypothetical protein VGI81_20225 [Tepidisphaeraceae bacterium]